MTDGRASDRRHSPEHLRRLVEASAWQVALGEAGLDSSVAFETWLAADPANGAAWSEVAAPYRWWDDQAIAPELMAMRTSVLDRARRLQRRRYMLRAPAARVAAAVIAGVLILGGAGAATWWIYKPDIYRTALGERRTFSLADGSRVVLDSGSELRVRLRSDARALELVRGQARFDVAHEPTRTFSVRARNQVVVATGTSFNVDMLGPRVLVTLLEGRVTVIKAQESTLAPATREAAPTVIARLAPGQQLAVVELSSGPTTQVTPPARVTPVSPQKAVAWETGQLMFDDEPLAAVAERVSRYSDRPVVVDGDVAGLKLSGVFNAGDVATFVDAVQRALPVRAEQIGRGVRLRGLSE